MNIVFETPRLLLRQFATTDAHLIYRLNSNTKVLTYLHEPVLHSLDNAAAIIENIILPQYANQLGRWAIIEKANNEFLGWCGLKSRPELGEIDIGYRLLEEAWGRGVATEAALYSLQYGFNHLQLDSIVGRAHIENTASIRVLEKLGMQFVRQEMVDDCPVYTYHIQKHQWRWPKTD